MKHIDDTWSMDLLDMVEYGVKNNKGYGNILVIIDNFSKFGWTIPLKNKFAQTITDEVSNLINKSKRKPNFIETGDWKEFVNKTFNDFLKLKDIERYSRYTNKGAVFAESFNRTIRNLLKKPVFEKGNANWLDELAIVIKKYNNTNHHSTKMTPIDSSKRKNEEEIYNNLQGKRTKRKPKYKVGDFVRTADKRSIFSNSDSTKWSYKLYKISEIIDDNIPSYRIDFLPERYNEALLKKSRLTLKENETVTKKLKI